MDEDARRRGATAGTAGTAPTFTLGTRNSQLAMVQTSLVRSALLSHFPSHDFPVLGMTTTGDRNLQSPLYLMGGKALWTQDLEVALMSGEVDMVVHSLKDMPTQLPEGCELGAVLEREDPRDALVVKQGLGWKTLDELPQGSVVGTSSVRRVAQLRRRYPTLDFQDIRGNLNTRMKKLDDRNSPFAAIILAVAGLVRLSLSHRITSFLSPPTLFHAVGQGALGIEIRSVPAPASSPQSARLEEVRGMVARIEHWQTAWRCCSERELLRTLEGGCSVPVGCASTLVDLSPPASAPSPSSRKAELTLQGVVTSLDGSREVSISLSETVGSQSQAEALGRKVAEKLKEQGADGILEELGRLKEKKVQEEEEELKRTATGPAPVGSPGPGTRAEAVELETGTRIVDLEKGELGA